MNEVEFREAMETLAYARATLQSLADKAKEIIKISWNMHNRGEGIICGPLFNQTGDILDVQLCKEDDTVLVTMEDARIMGWHPFPVNFNVSAFPSKEREQKIPLKTIEIPASWFYVTRDKLEVLMQVKIDENVAIEKKRRADERDREEARDRARFRELKERFEKA